MRIYAGNLSYDVTSEDLRTAFEAFGKVDSANVNVDRETRRSRGFGFEDMPSISEGQAAIADLAAIAFTYRRLSLLHRSHSRSCCKYA